MINEALKDYYILDGELYGTDDARGFEAIKPPFIYEVIRAIDGIPLFAEAHIERLRDSVELIGASMQRSEGSIIEDMKKLVEVNKLENYNIRIVYGNLEDKNHIVLLHASKSCYPDKDKYESGIKVITQSAERENPHAKVMNPELRETINGRLASEGAFEALLVDGNGNITEGSRSNFFYIMDGRLYTPPAEVALLGITRAEVLSSAGERGIALEERALHVSELSKLEGAFLTGTSIDALPISRVDDLELDSPKSQTIGTILGAYRERVEEYIGERRKNI